MRYSFEETMRFFAEKVGSLPPKEDLARREVELILDNVHVVINEGRSAGSLSMHTPLGLLLQPLRSARLKSLIASNFLGIDTGGCTLSYEESGVSLILSTHTTPPTPPQENWEWLHRLLCVAAEWKKVLADWDEFVPFSDSSQLGQR